MACLWLKRIQHLRSFLYQYRRDACLLSHTEAAPETDSFYWNCRLLAALADAHFSACRIHIERYQRRVQSEAHAILNRYDLAICNALEAGGSLAAGDIDDRISGLIRSANEKLVSMV